MTKRSILSGLLLYLVSLMCADIEAAHGSICDSSVACLLTRADSLYRGYENDAALEFAHAAERLAIKQFGPGDTAVASCQELLAEILGSTRQEQASESLAVASLTIRRNRLSPDDVRIAYSLLALVRLRAAQGRPGDAMNLLNEAIPIMERDSNGDAYALAESYRLMGRVHMESGDGLEAEVWHLRALALLESLGDSNDVRIVPVLENLAMVSGDVSVGGKSEVLFRRALRIAESAEGPETPRVATILTNLGNVLLAQGKDADAIPMLRRAISIREKTLGPDHPRIAFTLVNLGCAYWNLDSVYQAEVLFRRSLEIREASLEPNHLFIAFSHRFIADLLHDSGRDAEARQHYEKALAISEMRLGPSSIALGDLLECYSEYLLSIRSSEEAYQIASRLYSLQLNALRHFSTVISEAEALKWATAFKNATGLAIAGFAELPGQTRDDTLRAAEQIVNAKCVVSDQYLRRAQMVAASADPRSQSLADSVSSLASELLAAYTDGPGEADVVSYSRMLDSMSAMKLALESRLARVSGQGKPRWKNDLASIASLSRAIPESTLCVEYLRYGYTVSSGAMRQAEYIALALSGESGPVIIPLGGASLIDSLITEYRSHIDLIARADGYPSSADLKQFLNIASELNSALIEPIISRMGWHQRLFIAPDGPINTVSFAGLADSAGVYLSERTAVHYVSTLRDLIRDDEPRTSGRGLLAVGGVDYDALSTPDDVIALSAVQISQETGASAGSMRSACGDLSSLRVGPLPHSTEEIRRVVAEWESGPNEVAQMLTGGSAREDRVKSMASGKRALHFATHGFFLNGSCESSGASEAGRLLQQFREENPLLQSGLLFAGANRHGAESDSLSLDDGILSAYEVASLNLSGVQVVVLSACESALGTIRQNEGMHGLLRAFESAGAQTIIGTLWPVPDMLSADMAAVIYAKSSSVSLPERMQTLANTTREKLRTLGIPEHPLLWAGFASYGDWRN